MLDGRRGFSAEALEAEPFFVTAARAGRRVVVLGATQYIPDRPIADRLGLATDRYRSFSGFEGEVAAARVLDASVLRPAGGWSDLPPHHGAPRELILRLGTSDVYGLVFDSTEDPQDGFDRLLLRVGSKDGDAPQQAVLAAEPATHSDASSADRSRHWSPPLMVSDEEGRRAPAYFRLFELAADGSRLSLAQRHVATFYGRHEPAEADAFHAAGGAFFDAAIRLYARGALGTAQIASPQAIGDGTAEGRLLEMIAFEMDRTIDGSRFAWQTWRPDLLFLYLPTTDSAGHLFTQVIDPTSPFSTPERRAALWPVYAAIVEQADRWLGTVLDLAAEEPEQPPVVAVVSDHGMTWSGRDVFPNVILEQAGLLARAEDGTIDLERTSILAAESGFFLRVNDARWRGGIVTTEAERERALTAATAALLAARDPERGDALFQGVTRSDELPALGLRDRAVGESTTGELVTGDLYLHPAPGTYPQRRLASAAVAPSLSPWGDGHHGYPPENRDMQAIFVLGGPGVRSGVETPPVRQIDIIPTLAHLLELPPPADACGRVLFEALEPSDNRR
ncbi:MAG: alkaline phosphatase family protein [Acidobacteriota bacterium]